MVGLQSFERNDIMFPLSVCQITKLHIKVHKKYKKYQLQIRVI